MVKILEEKEIPREDWHVGELKFRWAFFDDESVYQEPNVINEDTVDEPAPPDADKAYQRYVEAYNKLTGLMAKGKGDTPEAQKAYEEYLEAKRAYEEALEKVQEEKK